MSKKIQKQKKNISHSMKEHTMETLRPANYQPVPAVRKNKIKQMTVGIVQQKSSTYANGTQQELTYESALKINGFTTQKPIASNLSRNSPGNRPVVKIKKPTSPVIKKTSRHYENVDVKCCESTVILSDDDDFYSKLTFDETEQSLEDEIFEELEKVAHDEAKLNAAIQNFDKILHDFGDKKPVRKEERPSGIPKPLQKSKTCSIIESKCILKAQEVQSKQKNPTPIKVDNIETIPSANYYQLTKSLWNLEEFESFAKSAKVQLGPRRSDSAVTKENVRNMLPKAKSVWEITPPNATSTPRPAYSRQSSISKIPIKLSSSMMQLNNHSNQLSTTPSTMSIHSSSSKLKKSTVYASSLGLSSSHNQSQKSPSRRPSSVLSNHSQKSNGSCGYAETKASLHRRNLMSLSNSINKVPAPGGVKLSSTPHTKHAQLKSAKSEMSIHGKFAMKATIERQRQQQQQKNQTQKSDQNHQQNSISRNNNSLKVKRVNDDTLPDKCLVKGQELLRKVEGHNDNKNDTKRRDYIAKELSSTIVTRCRNMSESDVSMHINLSSTDDINAHTRDRLNVNAITNHCIGGSRKDDEHNRQQLTIESEKSVDDLLTATTVTTKVITIESPLITDNFSPTLESCDLMIPDVLGNGNCADEISKIKDYNSDCSEDSGHISNENEEVNLTIEMKKTPRKISEELLEIFEKKSQQAGQKTKVIELNHVNLIKSSMEIYPTFNSSKNSNITNSITCKSEVKIFINKY